MAEKWTPGWKTGGDSSGNTGSSGSGSSGSGSSGNKGWTPGWKTNTSSDTTTASSATDTTVAEILANPVYIPPKSTDTQRYLDLAKTDWTKQANNAIAGTAGGTDVAQASRVADFLASIPMQSTENFLPTNMQAWSDAYQPLADAITAARPENRPLQSTDNFLPTNMEAVSNAYQAAVDKSIADNQARAAELKAEYDAAPQKIADIQSQIDAVDEDIANAGIRLESALFDEDIDAINAELTALGEKKTELMRQKEEAEEAQKNNPFSPEYRTEEQKAQTAKDQEKLDALVKEGGHRNEIIEMLRANPDLTAPASFRLPMALASTLQNGLSGIAMAGAGVLDYSGLGMLIDNGLMMFTGSLLLDDKGRGPMEQWVDSIRNESKQSSDYYANATRGGKLSEAINTYGPQIVQALPALALAMYTGGSSLYGTGLADTAAIAQMSGAQQSLALIGEGVKTMSARPDFILSFVQESGNSYNSAKEEGMTDTEASVYAMLYGYLAAAVEVGGTTENLGGMQQYYAEMKDADPGLKAHLMRRAKEIVGEIGEENVQGMLERGTQAFFGVDTALFSSDMQKTPGKNDWLYGDNAIINPQQMLEEAKGAALISLGLGIPGDIQAGRAIRAANAQTQTSEQSSPALAESAQAKESAGSADANPAAEALLDVLQNRRNTETGLVSRKGIDMILGNQELIDLFNANSDTQITNQNNAANRSAIRDNADAVVAALTNTANIQEHSDYYIAPESALKESDLDDYLNNGRKRRSSKLKAIENGEKILLTSPKEIIGYIRDAIFNRHGQSTATYGKVNSRLANEVRAESNGDINIEGKFLELVPSDLQHAYDNHLHAKRPGNIDLSEADFENIPKYLDQYDELLYAKTYPNGQKTICVSKKISNGRVLIIEVVSDGKNAVQFKNVIGVSEEQYVNKVLPENKKSLANSRGSESSNEPRPDAQAQFAETTKVVSDLEAIASTENIPQSSQESNSIPPNPVMKRSQTESHTLQQVAEEAGGQQEKLYYPSVTEKQTLAAAQARVKQDFMGEMNALTEKSSWTAEDVDTAFTIQGILQADGVRTRDFSAAQAWSKVIQDRITRSAQSLQAVSKWSRTGQAIVQDAMVDLSESNISAEEQSQIINDMQALADRLDATEDGDLESIRQLILDLNSKRNTGTFFKSRFSKYLDTITDFDWLKEFATRQLMSVPTDYTETASLGQKLKTWQTLAQLLRLPTFNRNIGGNVTFSGMDALVQDSFGIAIDSLVSKLTGVREVGFNKWWFSSKARQAAGDAYTKSILEVAADIDMTGEGNKYTPGGGRSFKMTGNAAERFMSRLEQLLSYSLTTSDRVSRGQIETANVEGLENANSRMTNAKADMITSDKSLSQTFTDITGVELNGTKADNRTAIKEQAADVVEFLVNEAENGTINPAQQALLDVIQRGKMTEERASAIAEQAADYDLFQNESTATRVSKGAHDALNTMGIGGTVDKTGRHGGFGVGDMLNPYPGVPANLGAKPIEFSPAGIAKGTYDLVKLLSDAKNGKTVDAGAQHKAVMEISRGMAGTPIIVALAALFRSGAIKNADDEDDLDAAAQAAAEGRSGVQWNLSATMRLLRGESGEWQDGDDLMSISWLEPLNAFMAIASLVANDTEEDATLGSILKSTGKNYLQGSIQSILDMPVMSSISNVIDTFKYSNADTIGGKVGEAALQLAGDSISGMMPAALFSQLAKATDDTMRSTKGDTPLETVVNGILNNIPGLRQTLDPKYDAFGEEKKYTGTDLQRWLNTYLLPGAINKFSQSETGALVESLYQETGSPDVYPDRKAPKYFNVGKEKINLTADQQTEYQSVYGQTAAGFINDFVNGAGYEDLAPEQKVEILKDLYGFAKNEAENAILEGMGMEPKEKDGYESAKKLMDEAGLSWAEYYDIKKGRDVNGDGSNSQNETVSYLLGSGFDDEKMESIYNALYPDSGNFSEVRDKVQGIEDAGFESLDEYNAANKAVSEARKNVTDEHDSSGNVAAANAVRDAKLTDEQKDVLISSVSTDFKGFYDVAREAGRSADDTIDLLLAVDATPATKSDTPGNGSISQGELKAYYLAHPEEEVIIALLWDSKAYKNGTDAGKWENNRPR